MKHRISAGTLTLREGKVLLVHHVRPGVHDFWVGPGGGVEGDETLAEAAQRETFEETGLTVRAGRPAYVEDLVDDTTRYLKFWFIAEFVSGAVDTGANPAEGESIVEAGWFARDALPAGLVFPLVLRDRFWTDLTAGFPAPIILPLRRAVI
jgi:ADP-ribose pyrophosphatase YjhB (NUDIX family)